MRKVYLFFILILFVLIFGCNKGDDVLQPVSKVNTLVILCDYEKSSDFIISILGKIKQNYPEINVEYIQTKPFDVYEASYLIDVAVNNYPDGAYFVGIIEPGSDTKKMIFQTGSSRIMVPDNGLATRIIKNKDIKELYYINNPNVLGGERFENISFDKFYQEAIIAMLDGRNLPDYGSKVDQPVKFNIQEPAVVGDTVKGEVLFSDNFGNCITNLPESFLSNFKNGDILKIHSGQNKFYAKFGMTFSSVDYGQNVVFLSSIKKLEIAVNMGSISSRYSLSAGSVISIIKSKPQIGFLVYLQNTNTDYIISGIKSRLSECGLNEQNAVFTQKIANGDQSAFPGLIKEMDKFDIIIPLGTPPSQAAVKYVPERIPIVYTYVTSPQYAGLIGARKYVTGISNATNFDDYLTFVKDLLPDLKTAGRIYNNQEANSVYVQDKFIELGYYYGLGYFSVTIASENDIPGAYNQIKQQNIKAILISADNTVNKGMEQLANLCKQGKMYLIADSRESAALGALAAISVSYDEMAKSTADYAYSVLLGKNPDEMSIKTFNNDVISINKTTAVALGYTFPAKILEKARYVYP